MSENGFSEIQLQAAAGEVLKNGRYIEVQNDRLDLLKSSNARLYEDPYSIACVAVFQTWADLRKNWGDIQADFVALLSKYLNRADAKIWDTYLVLLTPRESYGSMAGC
jgi:hypothetical protein